jgi:predicted metal-dependent hydrolase
MKEVIFFGEKFSVLEQESNEDLVVRKGNEIIVNSHKISPNILLKQFLEKLLYSRLDEIYHQIKKEGKIDVFGDLDFEIVEKIDGKKQRVAKLNGNKILVKLAAIALPNSALKYVIAHEIAHTFIKRHTKRFWKTVELMCPDYEKSQKLLTRFGSILFDSLISSSHSE